MGYNHNIPGMVASFQGGLPYWLTSKIYDCNDWPAMLDDWEKAVRCELCWKNIKSAEVGTRKIRGDIPIHKATWQATLLGWSKGCSQQWSDGIKDNNHMQVDHAKLEKLTDKECKHLHKRGTCFFCWKDRHMAHECLNKPKKSQNDQTRKTCTSQPKARVIEIKSENEEKPPVYKATPLDVYMSIHSMSKAKCNKLLEKLTDEGLGDEGETPKEEQDFWSPKWLWLLLRGTLALCILGKWQMEYKYLFFSKMQARLKRLY
jgi:hypothetical protein